LIPADLKFVKLESIVIADLVDVLLLGKLWEGVDKLCELLLQIVEDWVLSVFTARILGSGLVVLPDDLEEPISFDLGEKHQC